MRLPDLISLVGADAAAKLIYVHGGAQIRVPVQASLDRAMKHAAIYGAWQAGRDIDHIATIYSVTPQTVRNVVRSMREAAKIGEETSR